MQYSQSVYVSFGTLSLLLSEASSLVHLWNQRPVRKATTHSKTDSELLSP